MGDGENTFPPSKKRVAGRELSRDNPGLDDDDDATEQETGTFKRASEEVLASRRIVKVRRPQPPSTASSNPFAGISLVPPTDSSAKITSTANHSHPTNDKAVSEEADSAALEGETEVKQTEEVAATDESNCRNDGNNQLENETNGTVVEAAHKEKVSYVEVTKPEEGDKKATSGEETKDGVKETDNDHKNTSAVAVRVSSFQQLSSSQNAFTGLAGTGFSSTSFSFGSIAKDGSTPLSGLKNDSSSFPSFCKGSSNNGSTSLHLFASTASDVTKREGSGLSSMQKVPTETGEENEKIVFSIADAVLFEYLDGGWKERGKGELKVNISTKGPERARLVMRARGNYRLILNANLYPDMKLTNMDKRGITFACMNIAGEGKEGLATFALKFKDASVVDEFRGAIMAHKGGNTAVLKTPENSPKASED
eukprot:TRINITY_DN382_c0_g2_i1.p1 TRINITY_DN382_c0_g2~~TRINITY_DN382_c0_g2_i1.p1  ORF type:complete len:424 (-),score=113.15 TRINITY_DN382_c0_g2_i1:508-1779(-)